MVRKKRSQIRKITSRSTRGRVSRALAKTTRGGKGRIKNRSSYKRAMK